MERILRKLFDYQTFEKEPTLQLILDQTDCMIGGQELPDDLLDMNAAGDLSCFLREDEKKDE
ncbi:MAG: hypothetical protein VB082_03770 [Christensenella sp.]|nr:hypothetical protein [Christensenella sp.]